MNHAIQIDFRNENGEVLAGELANPYRVIESASSPVGLAIDIDQLRTNEVDVLVFAGDEMQAHRISADQIIAADEVAVR